MIIEAASVRMVRTEEGKKLRKDYEAGNIHHGFNEHREMKLRNDGVVNTLTTTQKDNYICEKSIVAMRGRNPNNPSDRTAGSPTEQRLEANSQGICNTLTSVQKDNLVMETVKIKQATKEGYIECKVGGVADLSYPESKTRRGRVQDKGDTCPTLMANESDICRIESRYRIRKLTPLECWRLMGFDDADFLAAKLGNRCTGVEALVKFPDLGIEVFGEIEEKCKMSNSQCYKQAGNSIVKPVLMAIFAQMIPGKENAYKELNQNSRLKNTECMNK